MKQTSRRTSPEMNKVKKERNIFKSCFCLIALILILIISGALLTISWYNNVITSPNTSSKDEVMIEVKAGDNIYTLAQTLEDKGVIRSALVLKIYIKTNNITANIKPGNYSIAKDLTMDQVITSLEKGVLKSSITIAIREGLRYEQTADILDQAFASAGDKKQFNKSQFLQICNNPDTTNFNPDVKTFLNKYKPATKPLRGFLYPDTYRFDIDSNAQIVIETMILNFQKRLKENNVPIDNVAATQGEFKTFYEGLILASIIQKESGNVNDDTKISGIFHNRLADSYPLQSDVTIKFILNDNNPDVSVPDTTINSPYNTYLHAGLPPTPIDEPGMASIIAAIKPLDTKLYFFIYDKNGNGYFAETYSQHLRNVAKYIR